MGRPLGRALGVSAVLHGVFALVVMAILAVQVERVATETPPPKLNLIYMARSTPVSAPMQGGGSRPMPAAPAPLEIPPHQTAVSIVPTPAPPVDPPPVLDAPVQTDLAQVMRASGAVTFALPGLGGRNPGTGLGDGRKGPGAGPGEGGLTGGGPVKDGDAGVTSPQLIQTIRPDYTNETMRLRVQGTVQLEAVVLANGTVGRVTVVKSLHPELDLQAIAAARKWLFRPGQRNGTNVDVIVTLILDFRLH
jgi:protein TonB